MATISHNSSHEGTTVIIPTSQMRKLRFSCSHRSKVIQLGCELSSPVPRGPTLEHHTISSLKSCLLFSTPVLEFGLGDWSSHYWYTCKLTPIDVNWGDIGEWQGRDKWPPLKGAARDFLSRMEARWDDLRVPIHLQVVDKSVPVYHWLVHPGAQVFQILGKKSWVVINKPWLPTPSFIWWMTKMFPILHSSQF